VKLKRQATAAFLGIFTFPQHVVGVCCIPTTIFRGNPGPEAEFAWTFGHLCNNPGWSPEPTVNGSDRPLRFGFTIAGPIEKGRSERYGLHGSDNLAARAQAATIAP
jgi:hypothetical protein